MKNIDGVPVFGTPGMYIWGWGTKDCMTGLRLGYTHISPSNRMSLVKDFMCTYIKPGLDLQTTWGCRVFTWIMNWDDVGNTGLT